MSLFAFAALAVSLPAPALDLERIEVKSGIGQPLLAEIPVVSAEPAELRKLQARLASPATFARIGLERPRGVVASLQFRLAHDTRGRPVIRVTSTAPVEQDFLTFLVQVDWGDGRMVREYSLSLSAPDTLASPLPPGIAMPRAAMLDTIARVPEPSAIPLTADPSAADPPVSPIPLAEPPHAPAPVQVAGPAATATPKPEPTAPPAKPVGSGGQGAAGQGEEPAPDDYGPTRAGDTLSKIASAFVDDRHTLDQAMLALLRGNPDAFIGGNINLLRRGAILRAPRQAELARYDAAQAAAMVHEQMRSWREGRPVPPQPAALPPTAFATNAPRPAAARLEISPGPDDAKYPIRPRPDAAAGAGPEGPPALAATTVESRDAEVMELRARVSELDALQRRQQALLALKDEELAARPTDRAGAWPWLAAAFAVLMPAAWWLGRRGGRPGRSSTGNRDSSGVPVAGDIGANDGSGPVQATGAGPATHEPPAWHQPARAAGSVAVDA